MRMHVLEFIERLKSIYGKYEDFSGGCIRFHFLLRELYPDARCYYNSNHVITNIDGRFYDWSGEVEKANDYLPITAYGKEYVEKSWGSFKDPFIDAGIKKLFR
jgi:hypothetical protein